MRAGTLVVDIAANVARLQKDMQDAKGVVASAMGDISRSVNVAKTALGALGVGLSAGALVAMTANIVKATAALDDMAETTGATVEELSKLQAVARVGGKDFAAVEDGLVKLTKGLRGTEEETKGARNALEQLGIQAKTATGQLRDPGEIMREVAGKLAQFEDGAGKTAIALDLFGKSGAKLLPFLKDLAEEGNVNARVTAEQAAQAEKLEKAIARLQMAGEDARRAFVLAWIDYMVDLAEKMNLAAKAGGNLATALLLVAGGRRDVGEINADIAAIEGKSGVRKWAENAGTMGYAGMADSARLALLYRQRDYQLALLGRNAQGLEDDLSGTFRGPAAKGRLNYRSVSGAGGGAGGGAKGKSLEDLLNESAGVSKDFYKDLQTLHAGFAAGTITLEQYKEAVGKLIEKQSFAKDLTRQHAEEIKKRTKASEEDFEAEQKRGAQMIQFVSTTSQEISQLEFEVSLIGKSTAEREKAIAARKIENDLKAASRGLSDEEAESLKREAAAAKDRLGVLIDTKVAREKADEAAKGAAKAWEDEVKRSSDVIERSLTDALMRGFEGGKGWAQSFKDALVNMFKSLVLRPIIQPIAQSAAGGVLGLFGVSAQGATGGIGPYINGGGIGGGGGGIFGGGGLGGFDLSSLGNTLLGTGGAFNYGINSALGFTGAAGWGLAEEAAALGIGGLGTAGSAFSGLSFAGPLLAGGLQILQGNVAGGIGSTLGGIAGSYFGPVGTAVGSFLGGKIGGALFGKKKKKKKHANMYLSQDESGRYYIWGDDVPGPSARSDFAYLEDSLNDPLQYDPAILSSIVGQPFRGERGEQADTLLPKFLQSLEPARQAAQVNVATWQSKLAATGGGALASGLAGYVGSMSVSEYLSPEQRLAGARSLYENALDLAGTGDATAAGALPGLAQGLLGAGRTYYASGPQFQGLFEQVNSDLARVLDQQGAAQEAVLAEMPAALREANQDTVTQLRALREDLKEGLERLNSGLRQLGGSESFGGAPA
jgi:hypothetical protein